MAKHHFENLKALGAGDFAHLNGSLIAHLTNTWKILKSWQACESLCVAGLYHAAYGTDGFDSKMVSLQQRQHIANLIGTEAEAIVYLYCSCDRQFTFDKLEQDSQIYFRDRFNGRTFILSQTQALSFCELTAANELELCLADKDFKTQHGAGLNNLFNKMRHYLSASANNQIKETLSETRPL